jgi:O-glycosyl hydrolase
MKALLINILLLLFGVSANAQIGLGADPPEKKDVVRFVVLPNEKHQVINNFSASDGWSMQFVGLWKDEKTNQIADWLFSTENDKNGQPKGIGLSLWRFNIGAGSAEQGEKSSIGNPWTRSECFLLPDGSYDWTKQKGQRHFLQLAKQRGVQQYLGFILSPPVYWTRNGLAANTGQEDYTFNLQEDRYDDFARFTADVIEGLKQHEGITLNYLCPVNEPEGNWNWAPKQEGTPATNREIARIARELNQEFVRRNIDSKILLTESFDYNCLFRAHPQGDLEKGHQIQSFFTPDSSTTYIGYLSNVPKMLVGHSYWTDTPLSNLRNIRKQLGDTLKKYNVGFWQTELCIMGDDVEIGKGAGKDRTMKTALYVARIIHHDLVYANASAWQWWRSVATGDYKDGLIYSTPDSTLLDGTIEDSKLMWALGNYSRFIRPGAVRLGVTAYNSNQNPVEDGDTDQFALMVSAYQNSDGTVVVVVINYSNTDKSFNLELKNKNNINWQPYQTSDKEGDNLKPQTVVKYENKITIPARTIVTYIGK